MLAGAEATEGKPSLRYSDDTPAVPDWARWVVPENPDTTRSYSEGEPEVSKLLITY